MAVGTSDTIMETAMEETWSTAADHPRATGRLEKSEYLAGRKAVTVDFRHVLSMATIPPPTAGTARVTTKAAIVIESGVVLPDPAAGVATRERIWTRTSPVTTTMRLVGNGMTDVAGTTGIADDTTGGIGDADRTTTSELATVGRGAAAGRRFGTGRGIAMFIVGRASDRE